MINKSKEGKEKIVFDKINRTNGITLVALVITIIIIIILSTITINVAFGDNGLINQIKETRNETTNTMLREETKMNDLMSGYVNMMNGNSDIPDPEVPIITGNITFGEITWSNRQASITVSTNTNYYIEYQVNTTEEEWIRVENNGSINGLKHGDTVYARLTDGTYSGDYASASIKDEIPPKVSVTVGNITNTSITLTVTASDEESGLATIGTYTYYLNNEQKESSTEASYNYTGLTAGTSYDLKVIVKDEVGNETEASTTASTTQIYTVTYYVDSGNTRTQQFSMGQSVISGLSFTPSKSGYSFVGWREDKTASSSVLSSKTMGTSNMTLYAVFSQTITLSYNGNGATGGSTANQSGTRYYNNGNAVNPSFSLRSNGFTRTNYAFQNWAMGSASGTKYNAGASVTLSSSTTFYATWVYATSTATLNWSGHYVSATGKVPASKPHNNGEGTASWGTGWSVSGTALSKSGYGIKANIPITGLKITGSINLGAVDGWTWYEGKVILCINGVEQRNLWYTGAYAGNGQDNLNDTTVNTTCNLNAGDVLTIECQGGTGGNDRTSIDLALTFSL